MNRSARKVRESLQRHVIAPGPRAHPFEVLFPGFFVNKTCIVSLIPLKVITGRRSDSGVLVFRPVNLKGDRPELAVPVTCDKSEEKRKSA